MSGGNRTQFLRLKLLGGFQAALDGVPLTIRNRKARAVLATAALSEGQDCSRERLRGLLWSGIDEHRAQTNLRQCLHILHEQVLRPAAFSGFKADNGRVKFVAGAVSSDVDDLFIELREARIPEALRDNPLVFETVLEDLDSADPSFQDWVIALRSGLEAKAKQLIEQAMNDAGQQSDRVQAAKTLASLDPFNETACRIQMQAHAEGGEIAAALTVYQALWERIDDAFGEEPSPETQSLAVAIKQGVGAELAPATIRHNDPKRPCIEISPLEIATVMDPRSERLLAGFRIELLASLVRFREWRIFEDTGRQAPTADYQLNLMSIPESSENGLLITLKDIATGEFIWSERLRSPLETWVSLQNDVVRRLAVALNIQVSLDRIERGAGYGDFSLDAYDSWLRGEALMMDLTQESWLRAERIFEDVINRTPRFTRGYCGRAGIENMRHLAFPGIAVTQEKREHALHLAREAARIDPIDSRTQLCLGWSNAMLGRFEQAELAFGLAHQHNENDPWTMVSAAIGLAFCDRTIVASALTEQALSLDLSPSPIHWSYLAATYFLSERYEDCVHASIQAQDVTVDVPAWQAAAEAQLGRMDHARNSCDRLVQIASEHWAGEDAPNRTAIAVWLNSAFPIRNAATKQSFANGLAAAGLSDAPALTMRH